MVTRFQRLKIQIAVVRCEGALDTHEQERLKQSRQQEATKPLDEGGITLFHRGIIPPRKKLRDEQFTPASMGTAPAPASRASIAAGLLSPPHLPLRSLRTTIGHDVAHQKGVGDLGNVLGG